MSICSKLQHYRWKTCRTYWRYNGYDDSNFTPLLALKLGNSDHYLGDQLEKYTLKHFLRFEKVYFSTSMIESSVFSVCIMRFLLF